MRSNSHAGDNRQRCNTASASRFSRPLQSMAQIFKFEGFSIAYHRFGNGPEAVLAFHGFGLDGSMWGGMAKSMSDQFTFIGVDAIYHGETKLPPDRDYTQPLQYEELAQIHTALMQSLGYERFWYCGYSMGGRLALGLAKQDIMPCKGVLLFAPDGLVRRPWYRGLAHNRFGYKLYDHWVKNPAIFDRLTTLAWRMGLIDQRLHAFLSGHSETRERRELVRSIWFSLRHIEPELEVVSSNIKQAGVPFWLFVGKYDSVIKPTHAGHIRQLMGESIHYHELETGHSIVLERTGTAVLKLMDGAKKEKGPKPLE